MAKNWNQTQIFRLKIQCYFHSSMPLPQGNKWTDSKELIHFQFMLQLDEPKAMIKIENSWKLWWLDHFYLDILGWDRKVIFVFRQSLPLLEILSWKMFWRVERLKFEPRTYMLYMSGRKGRREGIQFRELIKLWSLKYDINA